MSEAEWQAAGGGEAGGVNAAAEEPNFRCPFSWWAGAKRGEGVVRGKRVAEESD